MGALPRMKTGFSKLFCIGFNKTATTTPGQQLRDCGLRLPEQMEQQEMLGLVPENGDYTRRRAFCDDYDAFQNMSFSQGWLYVARDALFPGGAVPSCGARPRGLGGKLGPRPLRGIRSGGRGAFR